MLKRNIELIRDGRPQALVTWHKTGADGERIPVAVEFADSLDDEMRRRISDVAGKPIRVVEDGVSKRALPGSSAHFLGLPKALARLGFRVRQF